MVSSSTAQIKVDYQFFNENVDDNLIIALSLKFSIFCGALDFINQPDFRLCMNTQLAIQLAACY